MRNLLKEYITLLLEKKQGRLATSAEAKAAAEAIAKSGSKKSAPLAVQAASSKIITIAPEVPRENFTDEEASSILKKAGFDVLQIIPKGDKAAGALSGRFTGYLVTDGNANYNVVFTKGRNIGQQFEDKMGQETQELIDTGKISPTLSKLFAALNINPKSIVKAEQTGGANSKRPILPYPVDVGEKISDLTLTLRGSKNKVYISLKNPQGGTFANSGYAGAFRQVGEKIVSKEHPLDDFLASLGVDKSIAARGFTNILTGNRKPARGAPEAPGRYSKKAEIENLAPSGTQDYEKVKEYIASGYGFGYWYARELGGKWHVEDIDSPEKALEMVGDVRRIDISYPGLTKQLTCSVITTTGRFVVEVRNSHGGAEPNEIKVKVA